MEEFGPGFGPAKLTIEGQMEKYSHLRAPTRKNIVHLSFVLNSIAAELALLLLEGAPGWLVRIKYLDYMSVMYILYEIIGEMFEVDFEEDFKSAFDSCPAHDSLQTIASCICEGSYSCNVGIQDLFGHRVPGRDEEDNVRNCLFSGLLFIKNVRIYYESDKSHTVKRTDGDNVRWN
jgi:hypothetical protein